MAHDEKRHLLFEELLNAIPVMIFDRIERDEIRIEFRNQGAGIRRVGRFGHDHGWHGSPHTSYRPGIDCRRPAVECFLKVMEFGNRPPSPAWRPGGHTYGLAGGSSSPFSVYAGGT